MPPRPPLPGAGVAIQKMEEALKDLENAMTPQDLRNIEHTSLDDVREAAMNLERELASRQSLRNMRRLMPLFNGLEHYASAMNVMCNGTPFLPWAWAPITLILRIACEYVEAFEQIMNGYSRIAEALRRFEILGDAFSGDSEFSITIAIFYGDILEFHKHAYKFVRRNGWKILFMTSWGRFQRRFDNILKVMDQHATMIDREANARNIAEARKMRHDLREWRDQKSLDFTQQEDHDIEKHYRSILSWLNADQSDQIAIADSIAKEEEKYPDVCDWIIQCDKVKSWLQPNQAVSSLWIQGIPGAGKTFVAAQLVRYLRSAKMPFFYHFCSNSYASSVGYDKIIRSLISQAVVRDKDLVEFVYNDLVLGRKLPTLKVLEDLLGRLIASSVTDPSQKEFTWMILDGLDECSSGTQDYENVSDDVVKKADGMFLYARLVLDYLNTNIFLTREEVMSSLSELPDTLTDLYKRLLTQVLRNLDPRSTSRVRCVFGWVAFQKRPLKRLELLSAISFSEGDPNVANIAPDYILDICSPLLDQRPDTTITFIHSTVKTNNVHKPPEPPKIVRKRVMGNLKGPYMQDSEGKVIDFESSKWWERQPAYDPNSFDIEPFLLAQAGPEITGQAPSSRDKTLENLELSTGGMSGRSGTSPEDQRIGLQQRSLNSTGMQYKSDGMAYDGMAYDGMAFDEIPYTNAQRNLFAKDSNNPTTMALAQQRVQQARQALMAQQAFNAKMGANGMPMGMPMSDQMATQMAAQMATTRQGSRPEALTPLDQALHSQQLALQQQVAAQKNQRIRLEPPKPFEFYPELPIKPSSATHTASIGSLPSSQPAPRIDVISNLFRHLPSAGSATDWTSDPPSITNKTKITNAEPSSERNGPFSPFCSCFNVSKGRSGEIIVVNMEKENV
ncbi:hypothetical protein CcaCcLH18_05856 [Colletotrichum camelliae]|nr:hypothetical protein CcaCcLH18_07967 [Colletotrichum camelliae]KAH0433489.1 hypothetical protein CcaCcLH18_05856 [Colletotrichum camelliae]